METANSSTEVDLASTKKMIHYHSLTPLPIGYFWAMVRFDYPRLRNHVFFWIGYVIFKAFLNITSEESVFPGWEKIQVALVVQLSFLVIKVPLVYTCFFLLEQYGHYPSRRWFIALGTAILFIVAALLMSVLNHTFILPVILQYTGSTGSLVSVNSIFYYFFVLFFVCAIACTIHLVRRQNRIQVHSLALEKEKTEAELKYLKAQINPHFLFNTLNNIYSLARKSAPQTADAVLKLSNLMRFMLFETRQATIVLQDELRLIRDYIELERLRYGNRLEVTYEEHLDDPNQRIAPLLLIHFVENAFKHGASESRSDARIKILITLKNGLLIAQIDNTKTSAPEVASNQMGLENIKRQLELIYPQHQLSVQNSPDEFRVHLTLNLK